MGYFQRIIYFVLRKNTIIFLIILLQCTKGLNRDGNECHLQQQSILPLQQVRSIYSYSSVAFLGSPTELTETCWRMRSGTRARKADVEQCIPQQSFLSQPLSQPQFFTAKLCPNWTKPPLVSPHHQQTQPHGNHQSLPSTDLTGMQKQANIARESRVNISFALGTSWSIASKFNGEFHFWSWDALLKQLCGQIDFCSQYSALAETALMMLGCLLCHLPLLKGVRLALCFKAFHLLESSFSGLLFYWKPLVLHCRNKRQTLECGQG